jgi:hypothetical protein
MRRQERRRYQRITPPAPLRGSLGAVRIFAIDLSLGGLRLAHQEPLPEVGRSCTVRLDGPTGQIVLPCVVTRTTVYREAARPGERPVLHSGLQIVADDPWTVRPLRELISYYVERALDERKANALGIPATAAVSFQTGKGSDLIRLELTAGKWRRTATKEPRQPLNGFTVSAQESDENLAMLCDSYERSDQDGRQLIRAMAEVSISTSEGIPTRRYDP